MQTLHVTLPVAEDEKVFTITHAVGTDNIAAPIIVYDDMGIKLTSLSITDKAKFTARRSWLRRLFGLNPKWHVEKN